MGQTEGNISAEVTTKTVKDSFHLKGNHPEETNIVVFFKKEEKKKTEPNRTTEDGTRTAISEPVLVGARKYENRKGKKLCSQTRREKKAMKRDLKEVTNEISSTSEVSAKEQRCRKPETKMAPYHKTRNHLRKEADDFDGVGLPSRVTWDDEQVISANLEHIKKLCPQNTLPKSPKENRIDSSGVKETRDFVEGNIGLVGISAATLRAIFGMKHGDLALDIMISTDDRDLDVASMQNTTNKQFDLKTYIKWKAERMLD